MTLNYSPRMALDFMPTKQEELDKAEKDYKEAKAPFEEAVSRARKKYDIAFSALEEAEKDLDEKRNRLNEVAGKKLTAYYNEVARIEAKYSHTCSICRGTGKVK